MSISEDRFRHACELACEHIRKVSPYDTGNLALNAIKIEFPTPDECRIYVDESIAPYMPFTNERWDHKMVKMGNFRPGETVERFRTWDNPNEGWWDRACREAIEIIQNYLGGTLSNKD